MQTRGLSDEQVRASREKYGDNHLTEQASESFWDKLKGNFGDPMIKILCVALLINVVFAVLGQVAWYESVGIAAAVLLATFVSTFSEYKNENAFQKLQEEASQIQCKVYRNNQVAEVAINDLVVGDWVMLQSGDKIPADKRSAIEAAVARLKEAHKNADIAGIDAAIKEIETTFGAAQQDILNAQAQAQQGAQGPQGGANPNNANPDDHVTDVDFEEVK